MLVILKGREAAAWGEGWHFPVPDLQTPEPGTGRPIEFEAVITSGFRGSRADHDGVDIMYKTTPQRVQALAVETFGRDGWRNHDGKGHWAPQGTPVLAAKDGIVWSVGRSAHGIGIVLDHGKPWATFYQHLASTPLSPHAMGRQQGTGRVTEVKAGDVLGTMGGSGLDSAKLRHLHFEAWFKGVGREAARDPAPVAGRWARSAWKWP